jgi:hypothetical protein
MYSLVLTDGDSNPVSSTIEYNDKGDKEEEEEEEEEEQPKQKNITVAKRTYSNVSSSSSLSSSSSYPPNKQNKVASQKGTKLLKSAPVAYSYEKLMHNNNLSQVIATNKKLVLSPSGSIQLRDEEDVQGGTPQKNKGSSSSPVVTEPSPSTRSGRNRKPVKKFVAGHSVRGE